MQEGKHVDLSTTQKKNLRMTHAFKKMLLGKEVPSYALNNHIPIETR